MATLSAFTGLPVSVPLGVISLAGVSASGVAMALTKKEASKETFESHEFDSRHNISNSCI